MFNYQIIKCIYKFVLNKKQFINFIVQFRTDLIIEIQTKLEKPIVSGPKGLYAVYILCSKNEKYLNKCYIGYTPNPKRRLQMHNGQISGGAHKTHQGRPWEMILFVSGFPNKIAGLKFEFILTYPTRSQYYNMITSPQQKIRPVQPKTINSAMNMLQYILSYKPYKNQPLIINFLDKQYYDNYSTIFQNLGFKTRFLIDYYVDKQPPVLADQIYTFQQKSQQKCQICQQPIGKTCVKCPQCKQQFCLNCLAKWLIQQSQTLIPAQGKCFSCQNVILWKDVLMQMQTDILQEKFFDKSNGFVIRANGQIFNKDSNQNDDSNQELSSNYSSQSQSDNDELKQQATPSFKIDGQSLIDKYINKQITDQLNNFSNNISNDDKQIDNQVLTVDDLDINAIKYDNDENEEKQEDKNLLEQQLSESQISIISSSSSVISID